MSDPDAYIMLMASLPSSERLFVAKQPPLSRLRLEKRLSVLRPEDADLLRRIEALLSWSAYDRQSDMKTVISRSKALLSALTQPTLQAVVTERMELRTAIAALRLRQGGVAAPAEPWGFGKWTAHIAAHWEDPVFGLGRSMPWLRDVGQLLEKGDPLALERTLLEVTFRQLQRHAANHHFDFEAVVIYVLKWNIFDRWAQADGQAAAQRFAELSEDALKNFPQLQGQGAER